MSSKKKLSRRTLLRGLGVGISLPWLEAMGPMSAWADGLSPSGSQPTTPNRMAFLYVPNGKHMEDWAPKRVGIDYDLP